MRIVKDRIRRWKSKDFLSLWSEVVTGDVRLQNRGRRKAMLESQHADTVCRARQAVEQGQYRKAIQLLSSSGPVQASEEVRYEMLIKHPRAAPPRLPPLPTPPPVRIEQPVVLNALRSFPSGTALG